MLDVGSGSGYLTAAMGMLVKGTRDGRTGLAVGVEHIDALVRQSVVNMRKSAELTDLLEQGYVSIVGPVLGVC